MLDVVTAIPPLAREAGCRHCDPAFGGRSRMFNVQCSILNYQL